MRSTQCFRSRMKYIITDRYDFFYQLSSLDPKGRTGFESGGGVGTKACGGPKAQSRRLRRVFQPP